MTNMESLYGGKFYGYLKKQSQFETAQIGVSSYLKGYYDNILTFGTAKNKAKQSQSYPFGVRRSP
jgi:hypothetical protein